MTEDNVTNTAVSSATRNVAATKTVTVTADVHKRLLGLIGSYMMRLGRHLTFSDVVRLELDKADHLTQLLKTLVERHPEVKPLVVEVEAELRS